MWERLDLDTMQWEPETAVWVRDALTRDCRNAQELMANMKEIPGMEVRTTFASYRWTE